MNKLLLIDTSDVGAAYSAEAAKSLNLEPVFLANLNNYQGDTRRQILKYEHYDADTSSINSMLNAIRVNNITEIAGVITTLDSKLNIAVDLAHHLQVRSIDKVVKNLVSKKNVATLIPEFSPKTWTFDSSDGLGLAIEEELKSHAKVIVKPTVGAGGFAGKVFAREDMAKIIDHCMNYNVEEWIINQFIEGQLVSLEGFVRQDRINFLGFSLRGKLGNTESTYAFPSDQALPKEMKECAKLAVTTLVKRAKFSNGYFHSEFMMNDNECFLIDANFGRIAGGAASEVIAYSYGIDPIDIYKHIILVTLFPGADIENIYPKTPHIEALSIHYGIPLENTLESVVIKGSNKTRHTVLLDAGYQVPALGRDNWGWIGLLSGSKLDVLQDIMHIKILTKNGVFQPCY